MSRKVRAVVHTRMDVPSVPAGFLKEALMPLSRRKN